MFRIARYLVIVAFILMAYNQKVAAKSIFFDGADGDDDDESENDASQWDIFDWLYSIFDYDDDDGDEAETYLICKNCTVEINQKSPPPSSNPEKVSTSQVTPPVSNSHGSKPVGPSNGAQNGASQGTPPVKAAVDSKDQVADQVNNAKTTAPEINATEKTTEAAATEAETTKPPTVEEATTVKPEAAEETTAKPTD